MLVSLSPFVSLWLCSEILLIGLVECPLVSLGLDISILYL